MCPTVMLIFFKGHFMQQSKWIVHTDMRMHMSICNWFIFCEIANLSRGITYLNGVLSMYIYGNAQLSFKLCIFTCEIETFDTPNCPIFMLHCPSRHANAQRSIKYAFSHMKLTHPPPPEQHTHQKSQITHFKTSIDLIIPRILADLSVK